MKTFFITTPIYYPNARPHVGSAYTTIVCDVIARYKRMCGYDVAFLTGTDEHGEKLRRAAEEAGTSPAEFVAEKRKLFTELWATLGIPEHSPENPAGYRFVHTSQNPGHVKSVHWMIRQAQKAGYIEKRKYEGRYCVHDERYVSDSSEPADCDICGRPAELISEENYFFRLSAFEKPLLELYERHEKDSQRSAFVQPDYRLNEVKSFVRSGLRDISISRKRLKWGIPWPDDPEQVVYVWYDALTSYLTGIGFRGGDKPEPDFKKYWLGDDGEIVHMIGKDILRFHAVYWPAFLMAAGLRLPTTIFAHGWIYYERDKMSKSKGNVVYPEPIVRALDSVGAPGNDALRYYLLRDTPFGQDASFSYEGLIQRYNSDLANDLGNLANRTVTMVNNYLGATVPGVPDNVELLQRLQFAKARAEELRGSFDVYDLSRSLEVLQSAVGMVNQWMTEAQPWVLAQDPQRRSDLEGVLFAAVDFLRTAGLLAYSVLPGGAQELWAQLGCEERVDGQLREQLKEEQVKPGTKVGKPAPIFPRLKKTETLAKLEELAEADRKEHRQKGVPVTVAQDESAPKPLVPSPAQAGTGSSLEPQAPSPEPKITIEDFAKVEMRAGEIVSAERIPKADKLLKLQVDIGTEVRQVLAGIAQYYEPEKLVGRKVVVVTNLQPRKMRGLESNGMIVAASVGEEGRPVLATFVEDVPKGAKLK